ncbi:MAG: DUF459 domain-containing protein [Alphaproteobacteria bacterium]|nr:DUF459 domain-containing protein [Alphaproteobacteria bacterium]
MTTQPAARTRVPGAARFLMFCLAFLVAWAPLRVPAAAERDGGATTPVERTGPYHVVVFGDSMADGIWAGVYRALRGNDRFEVSRHTRVASGLSRPDFYDWPESVRDYLAENPVDIAIISLGLNDTQPIFHDGRWDHAFGSESWDALYVERVAAFMQIFDAAGIPTFWVGLPTVRSGDYGEKVAHINAIYDAQADLHDVVYVHTRQVTAGEDGGYSAYLPDEDGRNRRVRADDGIHFTTRGYVMLAAHLLDTMRRELAMMEQDSAHALGQE